MTVVAKQISNGNELLLSGKLPLTTFQHRVLTALCQVPQGKATTYKLLGEYIGCRSSQAIGQALRRNPYAPIVPCHRVVSHVNGSMCGFGGTRTGSKIDTKMNLLREEGVVIDSNGRVDPSCIYAFEQENEEE